MERLIFSPPGAMGMSFDPRALDRAKADTVNNQSGDLTGMDCPKCRNRGYFAHLKPDSGLYFTDCDCLKLRKCYRELEESGLRRVTEEWTFSSFQAREPWQREMKAGAERYAADPQGWLLMAGQPGTGKSHLCTAIFRTVLGKGLAARYFSWRDKIAELKSLSLDSEARKDTVNRMKQAEFLYIDDLFKSAGPGGDCSPTAADVNLAFEILNYRYINRLPTVLSTELLPQELVRIDEATSTRILEMAKKHCYTLSRDFRRNMRVRG